MEMETVIPNAEIETDLPDPAIRQDSPEAEATLTAEIKRLWSDHNQAQATGKKSKEELRVIRLELGRRLLDVRTLVSRPGRSGGFSAYVKAHSIPRATANELIARYKRTLEPQGNCLNEPITETPMLTAEKLAQSVWHRCRKILTTSEAVVQFLATIAELSEVPHERRQEGLSIFDAVPEVAGALSDSAIAPRQADQASQPDDETFAIVEDPAEESLVAPLVTEPPVADVSTGGVV